MELLHCAVLLAVLVNGERSKPQPFFKDILKLVELLLYLKFAMFKPIMLCF